MHAQRWSTGIARSASTLLLVVILGCGGSGGMETSMPRPTPQVTFRQIAGGLDRPVHITHSGDGSGRIFVVEQAGRIRILESGVFAPAPFLDIRSRVLSEGGEQGLLSVAFPPGFPSTRPGFPELGYVYVNYTRIPDGATVIARYAVSPDPDVADNTAETVLLTIPQPAAFHNGGQIAFGPDGFLYIGMGDGGPPDSAQVPVSLLGKLLRIDVESDAATYQVPATNPFLAAPGYLGEIWATGLRNPWRFTFDRSTGDLYIGDVGQNDFEEINFQEFSSPGGENYGWPVMEGGSCFLSSDCDPAGLALPVFVYDHSIDCSVTGGHVYRGQAVPALQGFYVLGDLCSGRVWGVARNGRAWDIVLLADTPFLITTFGEDEAGELYVADYSTGAIHRIDPP